MIRPATPPPPAAVASSRRTGGRHALAAALSLLLVIGCGGGGATQSPSGSTADASFATPVATASSPASSGSSPAAGSPAAATAVPIPDTPVGSRFTWLLEQLNGEASRLDADSLPSVFSPVLLDQVPATQLLGVLQQLASAAPFTVTRYEGSPDGAQALARISSEAALLEVTIAVEATEPHLIAGLFFKPATDVAHAGTWEALDGELAKVASQASVLAAEVTGGRCVSIHEVEPTRVLAIGSTYKLWVLGELAHQVATGKASWDESLAVRDELKSLPTGTTQDDPAGTPHPLSHYARLMISISDNTAADHVLHRLGRENVEAYLGEMGLADPGRNVPLVGARDLFVLKATRHAALAEAYLAADAAGRRELLDGEIASSPITIEDLADWKGPRAIDTLEWFASTSDLCAAMAKLHDLSTQPGLEEVADILAVNPGIEFAKATWTYVGYKGGSEAGVLQLTWLLQRSDDRWFVLSITLNDAERQINEASGVSLAGDAVGLLAEVP